jgi:hypothetical protein
MPPAHPRRCDDVQVGDAVIGSLAIIGLITSRRRSSIKQVTARERASGWSHACSESVS